MPSRFLEQNFQTEYGKSENRHWIVHVRIRLGTKFRLKLIIFIFLIKFAQKGYFWSKTEKVNITIEFSIVELV